MYLKPAAHYTYFPAGLLAF